MLNVEVYGEIRITWAERDLTKAWKTSIIIFAKDNINFVEIREIIMVMQVLAVTYAFYAVLKIDGMTNATRVPVILHDMGMQWPKES